jgi:hypothetical protein
MTKQKQVFRNVIKCIKNNKLKYSIYISMMETTVFLGTFNAAEMFWYPDLCLNMILSRSSNQIKSNFICHIHMVSRC